jgi:hypothetical protein
MGALSRFGEDCASGRETNVPIRPDEDASRARAVRQRVRRDAPGVGSPALAGRTWPQFFRDCGHSCFWTLPGGEVAYLALR